MSHFYSITGGEIKPRHFVPMAKDPSRMRATTTRDAKKFKKSGDILYPSVTTILNILDKPQLNNWKIDNFLETAFNCKETFNDLDCYTNHIKRLTDERLDAAPKAGTAIHQVLENYLFTGKLPEDKIEAVIVQNVESVLMSNCQSQDWEKEKYFVSKTLGYAGCADLISSDWVIDYKSKQFANKFKPGKMAYPEHYRQLAAYDDGCGGQKNREGANIFICLEDGRVDFHKHARADMDKGSLDFSSCLDIYHRNNFNPLN